MEPRPHGVTSPLGEAFGEDHRRLVRGFADLKTALERGDPDDARRIADRLDRAAGPHIQFEEEVLYPRVRRGAGPVLRRPALHRARRRPRRDPAGAGPAVGIAPAARATRAADRRAQTTLDHALSCGTLLSHLTTLDPGQQADLLELLEEMRRRAMRWTELPERGIAPDRRGGALMCRLYGFRANEPTKVECTLVLAQNAMLRQSRADRRGKSHPDGWGICSYHDGRPDLERRAVAAFADAHFSVTAERTYAETVLAHVRMATVGAVRAENTHPFAHGPWSFAHNGTVTAFAALEGPMAAETGPRLQAHRSGATDSEQLFYWLLGRMERAGIPADVPCSDLPALKRVVTASLAELASRCERAGAREPARLNLLLTDGSVLLATCWNHTLWWVHREGVHDCEDPAASLTSATTRRRSIGPWWWPRSRSRTRTGVRCPQPACWPSTPRSGRPSSRSPRRPRRVPGRRHDGPARSGDADQSRRSGRPLRPVRRAIRAPTSSGTPRRAQSRASDRVRPSAM